MAKFYRLGFITIQSTDGLNFTYKVEILNEFEKNYEVDYLYQVKSDESGWGMKNKPTLVEKSRVFDIHTIKSSWFKRMMFGL